jgi:5'-nucleotidase
MPSKHVMRNKDDSCSQNETMTEPSHTKSHTDPFIPLISDFSRYWRAPQPPFDGSGTGGMVLNPAILRLNDRLCEDINHAPTDPHINSAQTGHEQIRRALSDRDADRDVSFELKDGFGPLLGSFFRDGYENSDFDVLNHLMEENGWSGNPAKDTYYYPRPYVQREAWLPDRTHLTDGHNDLHGLKPHLDIMRVPDGLGADGRTHSPDYAKNAPEGAFPSGHTNKAYSRGVVLAALVPQLAPEILARVAEAENNRIVLGVHYPLDVIGGRVGGLASVARYFQQHTAKVELARQQLWEYMDRRCQDAHLAPISLAPASPASPASFTSSASPFRIAIHTTESDDRNGYHSAFIDVVSPIAITDRASALRSYRARLTYHFSSATAIDAHSNTLDTSWVPDLAPLLLQYAYPDLSDAQKRQILAITAIPHGCPFEHSSRGWVRLDLARALSQKVVFNHAGRMISCTDWIEPLVMRQV